MTVTSELAANQANDPASVKTTARRLLTELPGPRSRELETERRQHVTDAFGIVMPVYIDHAKDALLVDVDGNLTEPALAPARPAA